MREFVAGAFDAVFVEPASGSAPIAAAGGSRATAAATMLRWSNTCARSVTPTRRRPAQRLRGVLTARRVQVANAGVRTRIEGLLASGLQAAVERARGSGASHDIGPDELFARFARLIEVIAGRSTYVSLLHQFPPALERVMRLLAASRWATDYLVRHPILLDELLDERVERFDNEHTPDWAAWADGVRAPARRGRRRPGSADEPAARCAPRAGVPAAGGRPRRSADGRASRRPSVGAGRCNARADARVRVEDGGEAASRGAGIRRHCLRQARRQGTRLRLRPRPDLPVRRCARRRRRDLLDAGAAHRDLADDPDLVGHPVRHRPAAASERQRRADGVLVRRVLALPAQRGRTGRLGVGDAGADARPLLVRRRRAGTALRG